jgi:hypothetical protein
MARLTNQIVCVCTWLVNFQPAIVPLPECEQSDEEVESYFQRVYESDYDADTEDSEEEL